MKPLLILASWTLAFLSAGCAQHRIYVVANRNPQSNLTRESKISVTEPNSSLSKNRELYEAALSELRQGGFQVVASEDAEFTLLVLVDKDAHAVVCAPSPTDLGPLGALSLAPGPRGIATAQCLSPSARPSREYQVTEGIRLTLYPARAQTAADIRPAWDGFVNSGRFRLSSQDHRALLQTLLRYFGQDFMGQTELAEPRSPTPPVR